MQECRSEQEVKKSRFIGIVAPCKTRTEAVEMREQIRLEFPDARRICWAFVSGSPGNCSDYRFSDDGEPSGTAGKPILNVLLHNQVSDIAMFVVRYFGGIKLGAGGLVRAYSNAASRTLDNTKLKRVTPKRKLCLSLPYPLEDRIRRLLDEFQGVINHVGYSDLVSITATLPIDKELPFKDQCSNIGKGEIRIARIDT